MWFLNYENLRGFFENQTIVDDVISGQKWRWIKNIFGVIKALELNFQLQQSDLHYLVSVGLRNYRTETMFSIFKLKKIDQNGLKLSIQKLFYTKSSTQNPMSMSVFSNREVWKILKTKIESYHLMWSDFGDLDMAWPVSDPF